MVGGYGHIFVFEALQSYRDIRSEFSGGLEFDSTVYEALSKSAEVARFSHYVLAQCVFANPPLAPGVLTKAVADELRKLRKECGSEKNLLPGALLKHVMKIIWGGV